MNSKKDLFAKIKTAYDLGLFESVAKTYELNFDSFQLNLKDNADRQIHQLLIDSYFHLGELDRCNELVSCAIALIRYDNLNIDKVEIEIYYLAKSRIYNEQGKTLKGYLIFTEMSTMVNLNSELKSDFDKASKVIFNTVFKKWFQIIIHSLVLGSILITYLLEIYLGIWYILLLLLYIAWMLSEYINKEGGNKILFWFFNLYLKGLVFLRKSIGFQ